MSSPNPLAANPRTHFPGPAATVMEFLQGDALAQAMLPTARRYLELQEDLRKLIPGGLLRDCSILQLAAGTLVLGVNTPSLASKMRQSLPRLRDGLIGRGWKVNVIQLRVQPEAFQYKSDAWRERASLAEVPDGSLVHWQTLAANLEDCPLREAIDNLISRRLHPKGGHK